MLVKFHKIPVSNLRRHLLKPKREWARKTPKKNHILKMLILRLLIGWNSIIAVCCWKMGRDVHGNFLTPPTSGSISVDKNTRLTSMKFLKDFRMMCDHALVTVANFACVHNKTKMNLNMKSIGNRILLSTFQLPKSRVSTFSLKQSRVNCHEMPFPLSSEYIFKNVLKMAFPKINRTAKNAVS